MTDTVVKLDVTDPDALEQHFAAHSTLRPTRPLAALIFPTSARAGLQFRVYELHDDGALATGGHQWIAGGFDTSEQILAALAGIGLAPTTVGG